MEQWNKCYKSLIYQRLSLFHLLKKLERKWNTGTLFFNETPLRFMVILSKSIVII